MITSKLLSMAEAKKYGRMVLSMKVSSPMESQMAKGFSIVSMEILTKATLKIH
jgi:hypothetical protein